MHRPIESVLIWLFRPWGPCLNIGLSCERVLQPPFQGFSLACCVRQLHLEHLASPLMPLCHCFMLCLQQQSPAVSMLSALTRGLGILIWDINLVIAWCHQRHTEVIYRSVVVEQSCNGDSLRITKQLTLFLHLSDGSRLLMSASLHTEGQDQLPWLLSLDEVSSCFRDPLSQRHGQ